MKQNVLETKFKALQEVFCRDDMAVLSSMVDVVDSALAGMLVPTSGSHDTLQRSEEMSEM